MKLVLFVICLIALIYCKDKRDCYLYFGHSNMAGHCSGEDIPDGEIFNINSMQFEKPDSYRSNIMVSLSHLVGNSYAGVSFARGRMSYTDQINEIYKCSTVISRIADTMRFCGVVEMFGFMEGGDSSGTYNFLSNHNKFISKIREYTKTPDLPCYFVKYGDFTDSVDRQYSQYMPTIKRLIDSIGNEPNTYLVPFNTLVNPMCDCHHYKKEAYDTIAKDIYMLRGKNQ